MCAGRPVVAPVRIGAGLDSSAVIHHQSPERQSREDLELRLLRNHREECPSAIRTRGAPPAWPESVRSVRTGRNLSFVSFSGLRRRLTQSPAQPLPTFSVRPKCAGFPRLRPTAERRLPCEGGKREAGSRRELGTHRRCALHGVGEAIPVSAGLSRCLPGSSQCDTGFRLGFHVVPFRSIPSRSIPSIS